MDVSLAGWSLQRRFPKHNVRRDTCPAVHGTSRSWVYRTLGIPAITYEFGDRAPRSQIERISRGSAEEMMQLMLVKSEWKNSQILAEKAESTSASSRH